MKPIKMLGLAALSVLMAIAFAGAGSATAATHLCANDEAECAEPLTHVHETSVGKAILLASPKIECNVLFLGAVEAGEEGQAVVEGNFTYTSCTFGCTVTEQSASSTVEIAKVGHETAIVAGEGEVHVNCVSIDCYYNGKGLAGTAKGPLLSTQANGEVSIQEQTVHKSKGTSCPETAKLDIATTPLSATYISTRVPTALCASDEEECAEPLTHVHETSVGKAILLASPKIECNVLFLGEVEAGSPLVVEGNFTYTSCGSGCTVTEQSKSSTIKVEKTGHETAEVAGEGEVHVNCIGINCYYNGEGLAGTAKGLLLSTAANGEVSLQEQTVHKTKGTFCPSTGKLDITTTPLSGTHISTSVGPKQTVLCASDEAECAEPLTHVHESSVGKAILLAESNEIECNVLFLGEAEAGEAGQAVVEGNFTYSNCSSGCTVTEEGGPSVIEIEKEGHERGNVVGEGEVHVNCGIDCYYNGKGLAGTAKGPLLSTQANGEVSLQEQTVHKTKGTYCPSTGKLDITTTPLSATYITE